MNDKKLRIADLARQLGVHPSTVSRVLNPATRHLISASVVAQVLEKAEEVGYRPNILAAALRTKRSCLIGVLIPDLSNAIFPLMLAGINDVLSRAGYTVLIVDASGDTRSQLQVVQQMQSRQVDGLIIASTERHDAVVDYCLEEGLRAVSLNRMEDECRIPSVINDDTMSIRLAVDHLVSLGHRAIGHIVGPLKFSTSHVRSVGFHATMTAHGLPVAPRMIQESEAYTREAGRKSCTAMLKNFPQVTAIVAGNDLIAVGCLDTFRERNLVCPRDISLIGHNDTALTDVINPPLTTLQIRQRELGARAASLLLSSLDEDTVEPVELRLKPKLVVRASTGPVREAGSITALQG
ncbi:LacI family DNA-binding transcriptional regulator [Paraburkholderia oxyphila]|uniref:LacI family DNA-binding transcriptional regulator n=1 Tax=Paraburkholderia oxyphila TaxID=614212 RepID=UPI0005BC3B95|nr:LacI family DNA-binding transcriptional regulator [Paraburkholderia oxyphila]